MPNDYTLFNYQATGSAWLNQERTNYKGFTAEPLCGIIGDEMGLGKTATCLSALRPSIEAGQRFIFVVPGATVIQWQRNWNRWILDNEPDEFGNGASPNSFGLFALRGSSAKIPARVSAVTSHQMFAKMDFINSVIAANFDGIIIDEGHKFGGRDTRRIKHLWAARNCSASHFASARIVMTGTPVRNYADEIYNLLHLVSPACFPRFEDFARKYLTRDQRSLWNPGQFHSDVEPFYLRRLTRDVQKDLPAHRTAKLYTEITDPDLKNAYNREVDLLTNFVENGEQVSSVTLLGYLVRLRHLTGIAKAKEPSILEPMVDYLLDEGGEGEIKPKKIAVGLIHRLVAERLEKSLVRAIPNLTVFHLRGGMTQSEKDAAITDFQRVSAPAAILCNMEAGGAGIDGLQNVCSQSYIFERMWNGADEEQFEKRISRTGQPLPTATHYTIASATVDDFFDSLVEAKRRIVGSVSEANWETDGKFIRELAETIIMNGRIK